MITVDEKGKRSEQNVDANKEFGFHAADFNGFFRDNKGFAFADGETKGRQPMLISESTFARAMDRPWLPC